MLLRLFSGFFRKRTAFTNAQISLPTQFDYGVWWTFPWITSLDFWSNMHRELQDCIHTGVCLSKLCLIDWHCHRWTTVFYRQLKIIKTEDAPEAPGCTWTRYFLYLIFSKLSGISVKISTVCLFQTTACACELFCAFVLVRVDLQC